MKTAKEIKEAIDRKEKELADWAIKLIDEASERMFEQCLTSERLRIEAGKTGDFNRALLTVDVKQALIANEFEISQEAFDYYLKIK